MNVSANSSLKGNGLKKILIGNNYRKEWTQRITVPVLDFKKSGLEPLKEGGGKETRSLHVEDNSGKAWALRSIKKYPEKVIPEDLKHTIAEQIVIDDISASYPYGALSIPALSRAAHVPYLRDSLFYLGDDPALKQFRDKFKNSLVLMEEKEPTEYFGSEAKLKSLSTQELIFQLQSNNKNQVDQAAVLRARLLDNFMMDFDRHEGQWNWLREGPGKVQYFLPVPKDRDQVFYINQGILPKIVRGKTRLPELQGFRARVEHMNTFNRAARNFDRTFLTELNELDWNNAVDSFLNAMTDDLIDSAMALQPKEIQQYSAKKIAETLKRKKRYFKEDMMRYYRILSGSVSIVGSNQPENFSVKINGDGTVQVSVSTKDSLGSGSVFYSRLFDPVITKEIRLYGLEGDDNFHIDGEKSRIKIRMVGGPGSDRFVNTSRSKKVLAYDVRIEDNLVDGRMHDRISNDPLNNIYERLNYQYKIVSIGPAIEISALEGILLGLKFNIINPGFHKDPYSIRHTFLLTHSLNSSSLHFRYDAEFTKLIDKTDLLIRSDFMIPTNRTNFFGLGNNTFFDKIKYRQDYYHMRYDLGNLSVLGKTNIGNQTRIEYGPSFQFLHLRKGENSNKIVGTDYPFTNNADLYQNKFYGGGELHFIVDSRNNSIIPTRGVYFNSYIRVLQGFNQYSHNWMQTGGNLSLYTDLSTKGALVFATNFGVGHNLGQYEFPQSQFLGFSEHLRGYVEQRFAGRTAAYNQTEVRIKLANINALLARADFGVYGFNDTGRVWADGNKSTTWHDGFGGGIWLSALKKIVITGYVSHSNEVKVLPWVSVGFTF